MNFFPTSGPTSLKIINKINFLGHFRSKFGYFREVGLRWINLDLEIFRGGKRWGRGGTERAGKNM